MIKLAFALLCVAACADHKASTNEPVITGDSCALYTDATSCNNDPSCMYFGTGCACPPNDPSCTCSPGACASKSGSGSGSGSGSAGAACACPNGEVCFEQVGGPAQMSGTGPTIECTLPAAGTGDPCPRIQGEGTCTDSTSVSGLCVCDNGIR